MRSQQISEFVEMFDAREFETPLILLLLEFKVLCMYLAMTSHLITTWFSSARSAATDDSSIALLLSA